MKYQVLIPLLLLAGCQATPSFCEREPNSALCDQKAYHYNTEQALKQFDTLKSQKAFAIGKTENGGEFYGYAEGYSTARDAKERALAECQKRLKLYDVNGKCELIR